MLLAFKNYKKKSILIEIALLAIMAVCISYVISQDMLPLIYLLVAIVPLSVILIIGLFISIKSKSKILKGITIAIFLLITFISAFGTFYLSKTSNFINKISNVKYDTIKYSLVVLKDSASDIQAYDSKIVSSIVINEDGLKLAKEELKKEINVIYQEEEGLVTAINSLTKQKLNGILVEESFLENLEESNTKLRDTLKVIWSTEVKIPTKDIKKSVDIAKEPFIVYISGMDSRGSVTKVSRSDVNIIMVVNPNTYEILLVHIPRDYHVPFYPGGKRIDKLTHSGENGIDVTVNTIEHFFDIDVNYYFKVGFSTLIKTVDVLGGIQVNVDTPFSWSGYSYHKGINKLDGKSALMFSRTRKVLSGGDRDRGKNQQKVLEAIIQKASSPKIVTNYAQIMDVLGDSFITNMSSSEIKQAINFELNKLPKWKIESISVNGTDSSKKGYSWAPDVYFYIMIPDMKTVNIAKSRINYYLNK